MNDPQDPFDLLTDDDMLFPIFEFVGLNHFRFIAGVSQRWRRLYTRFQEQEYRNRMPNEQFTLLISTSLTSAASIAESVSRAKIFLEDTSKLTSPIKPLKIPENGSQEINTLFIDEKWPSAFFLRDNVAVQYSRVDILQLIMANGYSCSETTCRIAAEKGRLSVLQWLRTHGCPWGESTSWAAAKGGHLGVLQWARQNGCPWDESTCTYAAGGGHLQVLQWARQNGCPWNDGACSSAAEGGHLEVIQWARANSCPWNEETCEHAAIGGHLNVLQWARQNGCPCDAWTCTFAAQGFHLNVLRWAIENGCDWNPDDSWPQNVMG